MEAVCEVEVPDEIPIEEADVVEVTKPVEKPSTSEDLDGSKESRWYFEDAVSIHSEDESDMSDAEVDEDDDLYAEDETEKQSRYCYFMHKLYISQSVYDLYFTC